MKRCFIFFICGTCGMPTEIVEPCKELGYNAFGAFGNFHGELSFEKTEQMRQHLFKKLREEGMSEKANMLEKNTQVLTCYFNMNTVDGIKPFPTEFDSKEAYDKYVQDRAEQNKHPFSYDKDTKTFTISEKGIPFATKYEVVNPETGGSKIFEFSHNTGPEFDVKTKWIYKHEDFTLEVCNNPEMVKKAAANYLEAKTRKT